MSCSLHQKVLNTYHPKLDGTELSKQPRSKTKATPKTSKKSRAEPKKTIKSKTEKSSKVEKTAKKTAAKTLKVEKKVTKKTAKNVKKTEASPKPVRETAPKISKVVKKVAKTRPRDSIPTATVSVKLGLVKKLRQGRGFSRRELQKVDLDVRRARKMGLRVDLRRSSEWSENVGALKKWSAASEIGKKAKPASNSRK